MREVVRAMFEPGGPVSRALGEAGAGGGAYEPRREQVALAQGVWEAFDARATLLSEAGTGVGKSLAYLVPAALRAVARGETVVVATNTISLQEQLIEKDIPVVARALELASGGGEEGGGLFKAERALRPVLVKGRGNYLSIRRLEVASARRERVFDDAGSREQVRAIERWAYETRDGTLATLPQMTRPDVWAQVASDTDHCLGRKCPHYRACFYQRARREMEAGNLLVCNHALFFSDLALRGGGARAPDEDEAGEGAGSGGGGILPPHHHVVLDEAHHAEEVASEHLGATLTEGRVAHLLRSLDHAGGGRGGGGGLLAHLGMSLGDARAVLPAIAGVRECERRSEAFFGEVAEALRRRPGRGGEAWSMRLREPGAFGESIAPAFADLAARLRLLRDGVTREEDRLDLAALARRSVEVGVLADALVGQHLGQGVYWAEASPGRGGRVRVALSFSPVRVAGVLRERLFQARREDGRGLGVVLTSATMTTSARSGKGAAADGFAHARAWLGCEGARTMRLGSPFDFARLVTLHVDRAMPEPGGGGAGGGEAYLCALVDRILEHARETDGGAFVLFTNLATMNAAADRIAPSLEAEGMPLLVQGRDASRTLLLNRFRGDERSVLFGAASFWQGVDVRGRALRNVIITRLPFDPPDRPLAEARGEWIESEGGDPFLDDALPRAVIRFKQGFGRLVRSADDRGRVVVLDPRFVTKGYARAFREAVPEGVRWIERETEGGRDLTDF